MIPLGYFRYCDDIIVFSNPKQELHRIKVRMDDHMFELKLSLKPSWTISDISRDGIDFVGYVFYNDFTRVRKKTKDKMVSTFKEVEQDLPDNVERNLSRIMAYKGWTNRIHANSLFYAHIPEIVRKVYPNQF